MSDGEKAWRVMLGRYREALLKARGFSGAARQVGVLMVERAERAEFEASGMLVSYQGHESLARDADLTRNGVKRCREFLVAADVLTVVDEGGRGHGDTKRYAFSERWLLATEQALLMIGVGLDNAPKAPDQGSLFHEPKPRRPRSKPCTPEQLAAYQPDGAVSAWAASELPTLENPLAQEVVAKFKDWHVRNNVKPRDLDGAFKNWLRKERDIRASRGGLRPPAANRFAAGADRAAAKLKLNGET